MFRVLVVMTVGLLVIVGCGSVDPEECIKDTTCAKNEFRIDAMVACQIAIENRATHDHRWTEGFGGNKFRSLVVRTAAKELILSGNKVQFQNVFGGWHRMSYTCTYDPIKERVKNLRIS